jgi:hypothetical protein
MAEKNMSGSVWIFNTPPCKWLGCHISREGGSFLVCLEGSLNCVLDQHPHIQTLT